MEVKFRMSCKYCSLSQLFVKFAVWMLVIEGRNMKIISESCWCNQGGITCGAIDEPKKSSKAIDKRVILDLRDKNVAISRFCDQNEVSI